MALGTTVQPPSISLPDVHQVDLLHLPNVHLSQRRDLSPDIAFPPSSSPSAARAASRPQSVSARRVRTMSSTPGSPLNSNCFSEIAELETKRLAGTDCWACDDIDPDIAYVVPQADTQIEIWDAAQLFAGLILKSPAN